MYMEVAVSCPRKASRPQGCGPLVLMDPKSAATVFLAASEAETVLAVFGDAGVLLKVVMSLLVGALIFTVMVSLGKFAELARARQSADAFERLFWSGPSLDELYASLNGKTNGSLSAIFMAAMYEWRRTVDVAPGALSGVQGRMERLMAVSIAREADRLEQRIVWLGIVAAAAPLAGLAAVLWGLLCGLLSLGADDGLQNFARFAAQGMFVGSTGLVAAVMALICNQGLKRAVRRHEQRMRDFAQEFSTIISRQIDANS